MCTNSVSLRAIDCAVQRKLAATLLFVRDSDPDPSITEQHNWCVRALDLDQRIKDLRPHRFEEVSNRSSL